MAYAYREGRIAMKVLCALIMLALAAGPGCSSGDGSGTWDTGDAPSDPVLEEATDGPLPDTAPDPAEDPLYDPIELPDILDDYDCYQDIDIVFVLDVSTSMSWVIATLRDQIGVVWDYTHAMTDHPYFEPEFGLVVFVDDVLVTNGGGPYASAADLQAEFESWRAFCSSEAQPGGNSCRNMDCPENTLDALAAAAEGYAWRDGALHIAIHVTDDTFKESPDMLCSSFAPSIPVLHTYSQTVALLVEKQVRVGVFAVRNSPACPIPANKAPGFFEPWNGQPSIPDATGSRVWDLHDVQSGAISLTEAIQGFVLEEWCTEFI
jgi:hypothetical protein